MDARAHAPSIKITVIPIFTELIRRFYRGQPRRDNVSSVESILCPFYARARVHVRLPRSLADDITRPSLREQLDTSSIECSGAITYIRYVPPPATDVDCEYGFFTWGSLLLQDLAQLTDSIVRNATDSLFIYLLVCLSSFLDASAR